MWEAGRGAFIQHRAPRRPPLQGCVETTECKHRQRINLPLVVIQKWDISLTLGLKRKEKKSILKETTLQVLTQEPARGGCIVESSPVPEPIIVREADMAHGLDDSLSCHVSVSHSDCLKANYRWLNVPFFSVFWCAARPYTELKGRNMVCQMEAATNCSAQIPPFSLGDHIHPPLLKI